MYDATQKEINSEVIRVRAQDHELCIRDRDKDIDNDVVIIQVVDIRKSGTDISPNYIINGRVHTQQDELNEVDEDAARLQGKEESDNDEARLVVGASDYPPMNLFVRGAISLVAGPEAHRLRTGSDGEHKDLQQNWDNDEIGAGCP